MSVNGAVATEDAGYRGQPRPHQAESVDELFRYVPVQSARDLACEGIFASDDEVDEFIAHVYAARRADLA